MYEQRNRKWCNDDDDVFFAHQNIGKNTLLKFEWYLLFVCRGLVVCKSGCSSANPLESSLYVGIICLQIKSFAYLKRQAKYKTHKT